MAAAVIGFFAGRSSGRRSVPTPQIAQTTPTPSNETLAQAEARAAAEGAAEGVKKSKQAAAFLKDRNAQGFSPNPNVAKPFLLSL